jgi:hypothetical protein
MAVVPEARRCGAARSLIAASMRVSKQWGFDELYLHVDIDNPGKGGVRLHCVNNVPSQSRILGVSQVPDTVRSNFRRFSVVLFNIGHLPAQNISRGECVFIKGTRPMLHPLLLLRRMYEPST